MTHFYRLSMATVGDFLKFLSAPQNQLSPVALTYKNYFQYLFDPQEELEVDALQSFFDSALTYPHWQQNKKDLSQEGRALLEAFFAQTLGAAGQSLLEALDWPEETQVIEIEKTTTALEILNNYWSFRLKREGAQYRLIETADKLFMALILGSDQKLTIRQYDSRFVVRNGHIEPLRRDLALIYTQDLELDPTVMQKFEVSPFTVARFYRDGEGIHGNSTRGYIFQHLQNFHGQPVEHFPRLFFALKRIEQHFIRRDTDPYYISLVESLERLLHWMRLGEPVPSGQLHESFLRAQTALEEVFTGDKMLTLLLRDLEHLNAREQLRNPASPHNNVGHVMTSSLNSRGGVTRPGGFRQPAQESRPWNNPPSNPSMSHPSNNPLASPMTNSSLPPQERTTTGDLTTATAASVLGARRTTGSDSIRPSPTAAMQAGAKRIDSLKRATSPSTENASSNSESKWTPARTKSLWEENL